MKIEKITENKIRIIMDSYELKLKNIDTTLLQTPSIKSQHFFNNILKKAETEIGFITDGCELLIETSLLDDEYLIFNITKYSLKKAHHKGKSSKVLQTNAIYKFRSFDEFCEFCVCISKLDNFDINKFSKNISLYYYKNTYYLLIKNITVSYLNKKTFYSLASEFSESLSGVSTLENKLLEYGKLIIRKNAIEKCIEYFYK